MELRHLRYFVTVAEELHFTKAAARLQTAQPALSQQIRRLERELGVDLFNRTSHYVELTDTGRVFLEHARRVLEDADRAKLAAQQAMRGDLGRLVIGFRSEPVAALLPEILSSYRATHPQVDLDLRELTNVEQLDALTAGTIQVGLLTNPVEEPQLRVVLLERQRLVVAMPADHRLAARRSVQIRELARERWVHPHAPSGTLLNAFAIGGFEPLIAKHASGHVARMALVAAGLGLALYVESAAQDPSEHVVFRPLDRPRLTVDLVAAWRADRRSALIDGFIDAARSASAARREQRSRATE